MSTSCYRYAVIDSDYSLRLHTTSLPSLASHEVLLRITYCSICTTDLAILDGKRSKSLPYSLGHEYSGVVEQIGTAVTTVQIGDRVVGNPNSTCGMCYFCRHDQGNLCSANNKLHYSNGGFADYLVIDAHYVHAITSDLSCRNAVLTEPLACVLHAVQRIQGPQREIVLVIGAGPIGLLVSDIVRHLRLTDTIILSECSPRRRANAQQLGVCVVDASTLEIARQIHAVSTLGADLVFECSGSVQGIEAALSFVRRGGTVVLLGRTAEDDDISVIPYRIAHHELVVMGSSRYQPQHFTQALDWLNQGAITLAAYFDRVFTLDRLADAFQHARSSQSIKTLVTP